MRAEVAVPAPITTNAASDNNPTTSESPNWGRWRNTPTSASGGPSPRSTSWFARPCLFLTQEEEDELRKWYGNNNSGKDNNQQLKLLKHQGNDIKKTNQQRQPLHRQRNTSLLDQHDQSQFDSNNDDDSKAAVQDFIPDAEPLSPSLTPVIKNKSKRKASRGDKRKTDEAAAKSHISQAQLVPSSGPTSPKSLLRAPRPEDQISPRRQHSPRRQVSTRRADLSRNSNSKGAKKQNQSRRFPHASDPSSNRIHRYLTSEHLDDEIEIEEVEDEELISIDDRERAPSHKQIDIPRRKTQSHSQLDPPGIGRSSSSSRCSRASTPEERQEREPPQEPRGNFPASPSNSRHHFTSGERQYRSTRGARSRNKDSIHKKLPDDSCSVHCSLRSQSPSLLALSQQVQHLHLKNPSNSVNVTKNSEVTDSRRQIAGRIPSPSLTGPIEPELEQREAEPSAKPQEAQLHHNEGTVTPRTGVLVERNFYDSLGCVDPLGDKAYSQEVIQLVAKSTNPPGKSPRNSPLHNPAPLQNGPTHFGRQDQQNAARLRHQETSSGSSVQFRAERVSAFVSAAPHSSFLPIRTPLLMSSLTPTAQGQSDEGRPALPTRNSDRASGGTAEGQQPSSTNGGDVQLAQPTATGSPQHQQKIRQEEIDQLRNRVDSVLNKLVQSTGDDSQRLQHQVATMRDGPSMLSVMSMGTATTANPSNQTPNPSTHTLPSMHSAPGGDGSAVGGASRMAVAGMSFDASVVEGIDANHPIIVPSTLSQLEDDDRNNQTGISTEQSYRQDHSSGVVSTDPTQYAKNTTSSKSKPLEWDILQQLDSAPSTVTAPSTTSTTAAIKPDSDKVNATEATSSTATLGQTATTSRTTSGQKTWIVDKYGDQGEYQGEYTVQVTPVPRKSGGTSHRSSSDDQPATLSVKVPHGMGTMFYTDGRVYSGEWDVGTWHGEGRAVFSNGDIFEGMYHHDQRHGPGCYWWKDGRIYDGEFHMDQRHGLGEYTWPDGAHYKGNFAKGLRHGEGRYTFQDGSVYTGEWYRGKYHGVGECHWADGRVYKGEWQNGKAHGYGIEIRPDGSVRHDGEWQEDTPIRKGASDPPPPTAAV